LCRAAQDALNLHRLTTLRSAVDPESQIGELARIRCSYVEVKCRPVACRETDGIRPAMHWRGVGQIHHRPAPICPAVFQFVVVNDLISAQPCGTQPATTGGEQNEPPANEMPAAALFGGFPHDSIIPSKR